MNAQIMVAAWFFTFAVGHHPQHVVQRPPIQKMVPHELKGGGLYKKADHCDPQKDTKCPSK